MIILIILIILVLLSFNLFRNLFKNDTTILDDVKLKISEPSNNGFALMLEQDDGTYEEGNSSTWPTNMKFNSELSGCIDVNGNKIENALSFNTSTNSAKVKTSGSIYCYLYFDRDNSVYAKVVSDYTNGNGAKKLSDSDKGNRDYDTYYYTGNVTNNNVVYADHCWKMVITTEGNGVKMIYNGVPTNGSCDNTGDATTIGSSEFNSNRNSPAYVGYMYNKVYIVEDKSYSSTYIFGNSVTWNGSNYTLVDTVTDYSSTTRYTCLNTSNACSTVYYVYKETGGDGWMFTLTNGKTIEDALNEMLYAEDVNKYDSTIKTKIDSWYESNLLSTKDSEGNLYSSYLQNTIYCNNREIADLGGFNPNGGSTSFYMYFNYNTLDCENTRDQFTLSVDSGGTNGYGNNALKYPIGLISYKEASLAIGSTTRGTNYLSNSSYYWLLSCKFFFSSPLGWRVNDGYLDSDVVSASHGVRPAITLSSNVEITLGDGSVNNPYQVKLS